MPKTILYALAILVVLIVVWLVFAPPEYTASREGSASDAFRAYREAKLDAASRITIAKGKASPVELKKAGDSWVVGSAYSYPADKEKVEKLLKSMDSIEKGEPRGSATAAHEEYEVDAKKGALITAFGADGKELARLVVGKSVPGGGLGTTKVFTRFGDDPVTYVVESDIRSEAGVWGKEAESKNFLQKKVVSLGDDMEIQSVRLVRPDKPDLLVERKFREVPVVKPGDPVDGTGAGAQPEGEAGSEGGETAAADPAGTPEEKKPETKKEEYFVVTSGNETQEVGKSEEWTAKGLVNRGKDVSIDDAAEPRELSTYGLDTPQLKAVMTYRKKDQPDAELKSVALLLGNAKKDEKGETTSYYLIVDTDEHKGRVYVIAQYNFDGWNKEMKDFLPKPKEEPKPAPLEPHGDAAPPAPEAGTTPPGATPPGAPGPQDAPEGGPPATPPSTNEPKDGGEAPKSPEPPK